MAVAELGVKTPKPRTRLERRVGIVIAAQLLMAGAFAALSLHSGTPIGRPLPILLLAIAFAITGAFEMSLELRRHSFTFTLGEGVLVVGLFVVGPIGVGLAFAIGEGVDMLVQRHAFIKLAFNVTNRLAAATIAAVAFTAVGRTNTHDTIAWGVALLAALCFSIIDVASTSAVLSIVEESRFHDVFVRSAWAGVLAMLAAAPIGLVALDLTTRGPVAPLLLVPLALAVGLNSKYAVAQRDEHLRFERLYTSLSRTAGTATVSEALGALATEARTLGTGSVGLCCAKDAEKPWIGWRADDSGVEAASPAAVAAAIALAERASGQEITVTDAPELAVICADATHGVTVSSTHESSRKVVLVVVRDGTPNPAAKSRVETLETFAYQATLIVSNAMLHEERAIALARQIDLNRQKSDFVAAVSHELRTPLGVMLGSVRTLERLDGRMREEQRRQLFDMTVDQGARLQRLIDELLLVAAAEHSDVPVDQEPIDLDDFFTSIVSSVGDAAHDRLVAETQPGELVTDRSKLERVVFNLIENAAKYAPEGPIELKATTALTHVRIAVIDHGPGIPAEDRDRVFERFVQLDQSSTRRQGGTGLGLHLCRQLTELLAGELSLGETPGGGCTFTLVVPIAPTLPASKSHASAEPPASFCGVRTRPDAIALRRPEKVG
jgi:two-component system sensor histidine kinase KdpD